MSSCLISPLNKPRTRCLAGRKKKRMAVIGGRKVRVDLESNGRTGDRGRKSATEEDFTALTSEREPLPKRAARNVAVK